MDIFVEKDPNGLDSKAPGSKLDSGKPLSGSILRMFANALAAVVEVGTFGANKYSLGGWEHVVDGERRYEDAQLRHMLKVWVGEEADGDSKLSHRAHAAWNALAVLELELRRKKAEKND